MAKLNNMNIAVRNGGFIVHVTLEDGNIDGNPMDNTVDEYVVGTYAKLMKAIKAEFADLVPERKPRAKKGAA
jgi:hypothetical protein